MKIQNAEAIVANADEARKLVAQLEAVTAERDEAHARIEELEADAEALAAESAEAAELRDRAEAAEGRATELETALAEAHSNDEALAAAVAALANHDIEAGSLVEAVSAAAATIARLTDELAEATAEIATITDERNTLATELDAARVERDAAVTERDDVAAQVAATREALEMRGVEPEELADEQDATADVVTETITAEYRDLVARRRYAEAAQFYRANQDVLAAVLAATPGFGAVRPAPARARTEEISDDEWTQFNSWVASQRLVSSKSAQLSVEERNRMAERVRRDYAENKDLYTRCLKARK